MAKASLDSALRGAFMAGVRIGSRYPEFQAIPPAEIDIQFRAFKADVLGRTWTPEMWAEARRKAGLTNGD